MVRKNSDVRLDFYRTNWPSPAGGEGILPQAVATNHSARSCCAHLLPCHIGCSTNRRRLDEAPTIQPHRNAYTNPLLSPHGREPKRGGKEPTRSTHAPAKPQPFAEPLFLDDEANGLPPECAPSSLPTGVRSGYRSANRCSALPERRMVVQSSRGSAPRRS